MSDLERMRLIYAPHTSAGRLPTELGLRFFVDSLLELGDLGEGERKHIRAGVRASADLSLEGALAKTSQLLSGLSEGAGLVLSAKADVPLRHVDFVALDSAQLLIVLVGADGSVENRIADLPPNLPPHTLIEAANYVNAHCAGYTINETRERLSTAMGEREREIDKLTQQLIEEGLANWTDAAKDQPPQLIVRGRAKLLEGVSADEDLERVRLLFDDLETKKDIIELLGLAEAGDGVRIFIGSESALFSLSGSSLIIAPYNDQRKNVVGVLGIIGPTRMNYARIIPVVEYTAQVIGELVGEGSASPT